MNVWHESVPELAGKATSDLALSGCTVGLGLGQYHFADEREFAYFERPARARAAARNQPFSRWSRMFRPYSPSPCGIIKAILSRILCLITIAFST